MSPVSVMSIGLWLITNKALYLEESTISSCEISKIEGSLKLTVHNTESSASEVISARFASWSPFKSSSHPASAVLGTMKVPVREFTSKMKIIIHCHRIYYM